MLHLFEILESSFLSINSRVYNNIFVYSFDVYKVIVNRADWI